MYYGPDIMLKAGFGDVDNPNQTLIDSLPLAFINAFGTFLAILFIDKLGRRYIILRSVPFISISLLILSLGLGLHSYGNPTQ